MTDPPRELTEVLSREEGRLKAFVRRWIADESDVEDVLQDVFFEFVAAQQLLEPLREAGAWLFRVARNRITDRFRRRQAERRRLPMLDLPEDVEASMLDAWLPSRDAGPDALYARRLLLEALDAALEELPAPQREAFLAHEVEGRSFKELAADTGVPLNTLLSRKRAAVLHLRTRLKPFYEESFHD